MADTYYLSKPSNTHVSSPYLSERELLNRHAKSNIRTTDNLPTLYDEETHALLHSDQYIELMMQAKPLTYKFSTPFHTPDRFESRMDGYAVTKHRYDVNGHLIEKRSESPIDYASRSLAKQLRKLHESGQRVSDDFVAPVPSKPVVFDAPWWKSDSIYDDESNLVDIVLPVYRTTFVSFAKESPELYLSAPATIEAGTQYETSAVPRILIDAVTGTDEMDRDLRNAAGQIQDLLDNMTVDGKAGPIVPPMICCDVDKDEVSLKSPEKEYEFVNVPEVAE